ncbi:MAG: hypothetical protein KC635_03310 [Myxococcales bacterium]|nr:hypothetical protein [Myxococcales bacterium]MCB9731671.1 hypothetical protein [Deltaproteobacteria bacterium]
MRRALAIASITASLVACADGGHRDDAAGALALEVAPLDLPGVGEAVWDVQVDDGADPAQVVWSARLTSGRYGARGSVSYVGPCDATVGDNSVTIELVGLYADALDDAGSFHAAAPGGGLDFRDPGPLSKPFACTANADTTVRFDVTVLRPASQGFFDVAVSFADVFCSAKYDCDAGDLLFDDGGQRARTQVLGLACYGGAGADTALYLDDVVIDCGSGVTARVDPAAALGNYADLSTPGSPIWAGVTFAGGFDRLFQVSAQRGPLENGADGAYWNLALGVGDADLAGCTLTALATADDAATPGGADDGVVAADATYPDIAWSVPLGTCAGDRALDASGGDVRTGYLGVGVGHTFAHGYPDVVRVLPAAQSLGAGHAGGQRIATDPDGNVYVAGYFRGTLDLGGGLTATSLGGNDGFVAKRSPEGAWLWLATVAGMGGEIVYGVAWDDTSDTLVVGGLFNAYSGVAQDGLAHFGADAGLDLTTSGQEDGFVARLGADGAWLDTADVGGTNQVDVYDVAVEAGGIYLTGYFNGDATVGGLPLTGPLNGSVFVAALDADLDGLWAKSATAASGAKFGLGVAATAVDGAIRVAATGGMGANPSGFLTGLGNHPEVYVALLDGADGTTLWKQGGGGTNALAWNVVFDAAGDVVIAGYFQSGAFGATSLSAVGRQDAFVARATSSGWSGVWQAGGTTANPTFDANAALGLAADPSGDVYVSGYFVGDADFGGTTLSSAGELDVFVARLAPATGWVWARAGGGAATDYGYGVAYAGAGGVFATGNFKSDPATFGGATLHAPSATNAALFLVNLASDGTW